MIKYVLYIDYCSGKTAPNGQGWEYRDMMAQNDADAILEADKEHNPETMYLIRVMKKCSNVQKYEGYTSTDYEAKYCKRMKWHRNNSENSEEEHIVSRNVWNSGLVDWDLVS